MHSTSLAQHAGRESGLARVWRKETKRTPEVGWLLAQPWEGHRLGNGRASNVCRQGGFALLVDNRCKDVENPASVLPVTSLPEPLVEIAVEQISDHVSRSVAERAYRTLTKPGEGAESKGVT